MPFDLSITVRPESPVLDKIYQEIKSLEGWRSGGTSGVVNTAPYYVVDLQPKSVSSQLSLIIYNKVSQLKDRFEIDVENFTVQANAYGSGFKGSIHNDFDQDKIGYPTHRIVIQFKNLNLSGGELIFYKKVPDQPHDFEELYRVSNENHSEVLFQITEDSFHGISTIRQGSRISLLINIWKTSLNIPEYFLQDAWLK